MGLHMMEPSAPEEWGNYLEEHYNVPRETFEQLHAFVNLLLHWNKRINLIANSTIDQIWERHILDSIQLLPLINDKDGLLTDFGSGGGFPGIILAICGAKNVHLIEADQRKASFLLQASNLACGKIQVHASRIEKLTAWESTTITARALTSLDKLLSFTDPFTTEETQCLFLKGENLEQEITDAQKSYHFSYTTHQSITNEKASIINITSREAHST